MHRHMHTTNQPRPAQPFRVKQCGFSPKLSSAASAPKFRMQPISSASDILAELVQEVDPQMIDWKFKGPAIEWWLTMNVELVNDEWWMMNDHPPHRIAHMTVDAAIAYVQSSSEQVCESYPNEMVIRLLQQCSDILSQNNPNMSDRFVVWFWTWVNDIIHRYDT